MNSEHIMYKLYLSHRRKLKMMEPRVWKHHRAGWQFVVSLLQEHLSDPDGTIFVSSVEDMLFDGTPPKDPWVGFVHQVPDNANRWFPDARRLLNHPVWTEAKPMCRGLFVLCKYLKEFLESNVIGVPVCRLYYPTPHSDSHFSFERLVRERPRKLIFVGEYLRNFEAFNLVKFDGYKKVLLRSPDVTLGQLTLSSDIEILERVPDDEYDDLLASSIVFLNLFDAPANTTVIECIERGTPILVNRLPALEEYLGAEYPFFYESLAEASAKLGDNSLILKTHEYLLSLPIRKQLSGN